MSRRLRFIVLAALAACSAPRPTLAYEQGPSPAQTVVDALRANPLLLPYPIRVDVGRQGEIILSGKVGTKGLHDLAIRTVIDLGLVPHDDLVIDTREAHRVALEQTYGGGAVVAASPLGPAPTFVYPEPLFGRLDDPFYGFEPPILSLPPRVDVPGVALAGRPAPTPDEAIRRAAAPVKGRIQLAVDEFGQVSLSGDVASEEDKWIIEQEASRVPGVTRVASDLRVVSRTTPPPPPKPLDGRPIELQRPVPPPPPPQAVPAPAPARPGVGDPLGTRVEQAIERRPALRGLPIDTQAADDVVTISGKVPSAYEAMLAFRAVQQTPGVREVVDKLEFPLPDENHPNPLKAKARPSDLEPYFLNQIRRHAGDTAHVDRVEVRGDVVQVSGSLSPGEDQARMDALLRSIPLLRDFRIESNFLAD
ncbi:BON domain-containing protein [Planctomyces sp. SH-PL62]|uniref:BON domain-containing protein n=1 Tax=Planctomyces sp. SH-PL62 TaxID=1636152 RepID=UPI00078E2042|nr:BON domain-containing protein [Planctomyces sp. SH-PL62]AMV39839.1 periplasmic protein [Planctomyces sp. SH-PL62]